MNARNVLFLQIIGCFASRLRYLAKAVHLRLRIALSKPLQSLFPLGPTFLSNFCWATMNAGTFETVLGGGGGTIIPSFRYSCNKKACNDATLLCVLVTQYSITLDVE